ncbi:MAG TPA: class I SAM-dependent methyltransferase, partial [Patescibacteria group bacterium]|nr:class I SAM-dependent methyltransferase [Patescibacteria group bacterium]
MKNMEDFEKMMPEKKVEQYDHISEKYADLVKTDPQKRFVQYPEALRLLGEIERKKILDVGCGSGDFDKELAKKGAIVTGCDESAEQISNAKKNVGDLDIEFITSKAEDFKSEKKFDMAVSVLVLHYANNTEQLRQIFKSTLEALEDKNSKFVCILVNPNYKNFDTVSYNRRFTRLPNKRMKADFFDNAGNASFSAEFSDFSAEDYENAAQSAG